MVFVTKYRRKVLTATMRKYLETAFAGILADWRCRLLEFGGEDDHVHLLVEIHPALNLSTLINNLKSASSRRVRNKFPVHIAKFYGKPYFWNRAYYVGSVGNVTLETIQRYVQQQGTTERHPNPKDTA
jgi:putative transposase